MREFKGTIARQCNQINNKIRISQMIVNLQIFRINELQNDFSRHPNDKLIELQRYYNRLNEYKSHIKTLEENLIIISCA